MIHKWLKRLISVLEIGGGFLGLVICLSTLFSSSGSLPEVVVSLVFSGVFIFGIIAGVCLIEDRKSGTILSLLFQAIQIFRLSSGLITFSFGSGFVFSLVIVNGQFNLEFNLGSQFFLSLFQDNAPFGFGINLISLFFFLYLLCILISEREQKTDEQEEADLIEDDEQPSSFRNFS